MASITSPGIGSGLDVNSIVTQLLAVERTPLQQMQTEASKIQNKLSVYGKIQSYVSGLRDAAATLAKTDTWGTTTAASSDPTVATANTDASAAAGNYSLTVGRLATAQTLASAAWPATISTVGSGTLTISMAGGTDATISVSASDTLSDVRDKINAAKSGVLASIVKDANGSRLVMRSAETGAANSFTVTAADDGGNPSSSLDRLAFPPPAGLAEADAARRTQEALNARATINGIDVESASNRLSGVVDGLTVQLTKVSATPVDISVASNTEAMKTAITAFADAYNSLNKYLADQTRYDSATQKAAPLQGDSGTNALRQAMRNIVGDTNGAGGVFSRLAQVGIDTKTDGSLSIDATKLTTALGQASELKTLFATKDTAVDANNGFALRLQKWGDQLLAFDGQLSSRSDSLQRQIDANSKKQDAFNQRLTQVEARLRAQYAALDTRMGQLNGLSTYMSQQVAAWNKSTS